MTKTLEPPNQNMIEAWTMRFLEGKTFKTIAQKLEISPPTASAWVNNVIEYEQERLGTQIDGLRAMHMSYCQRLLSDVWEQWNRSKEDFVRFTNREGGEKDSFTETVTEGRVGDARLFAEMTKLLRDMRQMIGVNEPPKEKVDKQEGEGVPKINLSAAQQYAEVSDDELKALAMAEKVYSRLDMMHKLSTKN